MSVEVLADRLMRAHGANAAAAATDAAAIAPLRDAILDVDFAYAIQEASTRRWIDAGRRLAGRRIGMTSVAVQEQTGIDRPDHGALFADMILPTGQPVPLAGFLQPRIAGAIGFQIDARLDHADITTVELVAAIRWAFPVIEVLDSRIAGWDIGFVDSLADNACTGACIPGSVRVPVSAVDLDLCGMVIEHRGEPVSTGAGTATLGNPVNAALWLARKMADVGRPVDAGDIVLTGALGPMVSVDGPGSYELRIAGLGSVRAEFV